MRANKLLWVGIPTAILFLAATCAVTIGAKPCKCKSSSCTYYDAQYGAHAGTCGCKEGDIKDCYCFDNEDKSLSQRQGACSATKTD
jgi:hypothetical protein